MVATNTTAKKPQKSTRGRKASPETASAANDTLTQVLATTPVQLLPYASLSATPLNVRRVLHTEKEVEELADSIEAVGIRFGSISYCSLQAWRHSLSKSISSQNGPGSRICRPAPNVGSGQRANGLVGVPKRVYRLNIEG